MSDAKKLAEEIIDAISLELANMDAEALTCEADRLKEIESLEPGMGHALRLACTVFDRWKEDHGRPAN